MSNEGLPRARRSSLLVLSLALALVVADLAFRAVDTRLSGNLAHIANIPGIIQNAASGTARGMLVLGNSLTNNGVSQAALAEALPGTTIGKVSPDGTNLWDWACILDNEYTERRDLKLDAVVLGYGWRLVSDQTPPDASRLGAHYCKLSDLAEPARIGLTDVAGIGEFLSAKMLHIYGVRQTLRNRFLELIIPHYKQFAQEANASRAGAPIAASPADGSRHTYDALRALAGRLAQRGTRLVLVAMPVQGSYDIDPELRDLDRQGLVTLIDFRSLDGIVAADFLDSMHLGKEGQRILTAALAAELANARVARQ